MHPRELLPVAFLCSGLASAHTHLREWRGTAPEDALGRGLADVGDVDGDGIHDFALGMPGDDLQGNDFGKVIVVAGSDGHEIRALYGAHYDRRFGSTVTAVPDLDGDGATDVLIQSGGYAANTYRYVAVSVGTGAFLWSYALTNYSFYLGADAVVPTAAAVGDVDADGRMDVAIGVPEGDSYNSSRVVVVSGATGSVLHSIAQPAPDSYLGMGLCAAGDLDQDGHADWWMTRNVNYFYTFVEARSGLDGHKIREIALPFIYESDIVVRMAANDDIDADGVPELLVAVPAVPIAGVNGPGRISVYSGATGALLWSRSGRSSSLRIGWTIHDVGDIDGDGTRDFATPVGYPLPSGYGGFYAGVNTRREILSGKTGTTIRRFNAPPGVGDIAAITGAGDVDGDGQNDVLYSAMTTTYSYTLGQYTYSSGLVAASSLVHVNLAGSCFELDNAAGGHQTLSVDFGPQFAHRSFRILGSKSGAQPGVATPAGTLPIAVDAYFQSTASAAGDSHLREAFGKLDAEGRATATFKLHPGSMRFPPGTSVLHAAVALDAAGTSVSAISRAVPLFVR